MHAFRITFRHFIIFLHNLPTIIIVVIYFPVELNFYTLLAILGVIIAILNIAWVNILFGLVGARFRDVSQAIMAFVQPAMFLTPVFWRPEILGKYIWAAHINPLYHFIQILRAPILGASPTLLNYYVTISFTVIGWVATVVMFARFRGRLQFWM